MDPSALETDPSEARTAIFGQRVGTEVQPQNEMWAGSKVHHLTGHDLTGRLSNHDLAAAMRDLHTRICANGAIAKIGPGR